MFLNGKDLFAMGENERTIFRRRNIGFIFQSFHLIPELNVEQNMIFPLLLDGKKPDQEHVDEMLEILGLADRRKHLPGQLSGGQQQRVAIGRALITRPFLVLADEPTGNLDEDTAQDVVELLVEKARARDKCVIIVSHSPKVAESADVILRFSRGKVDVGGADAQEQEESV